MPPQNSRTVHRLNYSVDDEFHGPWLVSCTECEFVATVALVDEEPRMTVHEKGQPDAHVVCVGFRSPNDVGSCPIH